MITTKKAAILFACQLLYSFPVSCYTLLLSAVILFSCQLLYFSLGRVTVVYVVKAAAAELILQQKNDELSKLAAASYGQPENGRD